MNEPPVSPAVRAAVFAKRGRLTVFPKLDPTRTALVVVDMQNAFCTGADREVPAVAGTIPNINRLALATRTRGGIVIWVRMLWEETDTGWSVWRDYFHPEARHSERLNQLKPEAESSALHPALDVRDGDLHVTKRRFSALIPGSSDLQEVLARHRIDTLLIAGTRTSICCESTARDAMMLNYKVLMVSDATADLTEGRHQAALDAVFYAFGDVVNTEEAIRRLG